MKLLAAIICFFALPLIAIAQQPRLVLPFGETNVYAVKFSPDGKKLVTAGFKIMVWDVATGRLLIEIKEFNANTTIDQIDFSPDGERLVANSLATAIIWDISSGKRKVSLIGHRDYISSVMYSSDGKRVITSSFDSTVKIWDAFTGKVLLNLKAFNGEVENAKFSYDDKKIFTLSWDSTVRIWDAAKGNILKSISDKKNKENIRQIEISQNSKIICLVLDGYVLLSDSQTGKIIQRINIQLGNLFKIRFTSDEKKIIICDESNKIVTVVDVLTGKELNKYVYIGKLAVLSTDGSKICLYSKNEKPVIIDALNGVALSEIKFVNPNSDELYFQAFFNRNGNQICTFPVGQIGSTSKAEIWDVNSGKPISKIASHINSLISSEFSQDGNEIVTRVGTSAYIWNVTTGEPRVIIEGKMICDAISITADGHYLYSATSDKDVKMWDIKTGSIVGRFEGNANQFNPFTISPNNDLLSINTIDGKAAVFDVKSGKYLFGLKGVDEVYSSVFSGDGKKILTQGSSWAYVWNTKSGQMITQMKNEDFGNFRNSEFSPDGNKVVTSNGYDEVGVWDADKGELKLLLKKQRFGKYSLDGSKLITVSDAGYLNIWDTDKGKMINTIKSHKLIYNEMISLNSIFPFQLDKSGKKLITNTENGSSYILNFDLLTPESILKGYSGFVKSASFDPGNNMVVTTLTDNTSKVWNVNDGSLLLTFIIIDSVDYLSILPTGYYKCSPNAAKLLHYVTPDSRIITFEQLDVKYNRPDKVLERIGNVDTTLIKSFRKAYEKRIQRLGIDTTYFRDGYSVPTTSIMNSDTISINSDNSLASLHINSFDSTYLLDRFNLWVNDVPVYGLKGISIKGQNSKAFDTTLGIILNQGENRIETSVLNVNGTESYRSPFFINYVPAQPKKEKVHFIGIGISQFANPSYNLTWSVKDIRDLATKLKKHYGESISIDTLFDLQVTRENVKSLKQHLMSLSEDDKVIISYSGHGVLSKDFDYFLSTYDISFDHPETSGLPYDDLESLLDGIRPRKKLMLIDACHSGELDKDEIAKIEQSKAKLDSSGITHKSEITVVPKKSVGMSNSFELMQRLFVNVGRGTGATIISAAGGMQYAQERGDLKNGVFTYSILEAFNNNKTLTVSELKKIVGERVTALTNGLQKPTSRNETINVDWQVW